MSYCLILDIYLRSRLASKVMFVKLLTGWLYDMESVLDAPCNARIARPIGVYTFVNYLQYYNFTNNNFQNIDKSEISKYSIDFSHKKPDIEILVSVILDKSIFWPGEMKYYLIIYFSVECG